VTGPHPGRATKPTALEIANNSCRQMLDFIFAPLTLPEFDYEVEA
jgi:hypothetical protein